MAAGLEKVDAIIKNLVNQAVLSSNTPGPGVLSPDKRLRLANPDKRVTENPFYQF
jgi:hypothetical protein